MYRILIPLKRWGIPPCPEEELALPSDATMRQRVIHYAVTTYNPLAAVRIAGPIGPRLITKYRKDIERKFRHIFSDTSVVSKYLYHLNAQDPSGEIAFKALGRLLLYYLLIYKGKTLWYAKEPLLDRLHTLPSSIFVSFLYGDVSILYLDLLYFLLTDQRGLGWI